MHTDKQNPRIQRRENTNQIITRKLERDSAVAFNAKSEDHPNHYDNISIIRYGFRTDKRTYEHSARPYDEVLITNTHSNVLTATMVRKFQAYE